MATPFHMPDLGEGIHEGEILAVLVDVGQKIKEGDLILEVETDKAAVEIPSPFTGAVIEIHVKTGDIVQVGDVLMSFATTEEEAAVAVDKPQLMKTSPPEAEVPGLVLQTPDKEGPVPASPATRRLSRELGVDLHAVTPSGKGALVTADDVRAFAGKETTVASTMGVNAELPVGPSPVALPAPDLPDFTKWGQVERVPFRSIRRATAKQMSLAWAQIPHVNSQDEIDVTRLEAFRRKHKSDIEKIGGRLTMTVFALKAVATALKTYPDFNASLDTRSGEIIIKKYFHIGVAVNTANGLIVPVVRDVDRKSIKELTVELNEIALKARERKTPLEDLQGGTFTITNIGAMGGGFFAPIINYPQVAILGMGRAQLKPWVVDGADGPEIAPRLIMPLVLTIDHRVLDGADAIRFIGVVKEVLEDPDELLMSMV